LLTLLLAFKHSATGSSFWARTNAGFLIHPPDNSVLKLPEKSQLLRLSKTVNLFFPAQIRRNDRLSSTERMPFKTCFANLEGYQNHWKEKLLMKIHLLAMIAGVVVANVAFASVASGYVPAPLYRLKSDYPHSKCGQSTQSIGTNGRAQQHLDSSFGNEKAYNIESGRLAVQLICTEYSNGRINVVMPGAR
jgi:hypothetical protein